MNEISVIIPVYRGEATLARALDSALAQEETARVIVVHDCSEEDIDGVMAPYLGNDRVLYLKNSENLGAAESRNRGVAAAETPYVAFLDADDCWEAGKLRRQLAVLEQTGAVLCATGRALMTPDGTLTGRVIGVPETITYRQLLKHNCISCSSVVLRREAALEFPMRCAQDSHEDYILWLELLRKYGSARDIDEPLLRYTVSTTGKSGSKLQSARMTWRVYRHMGFGIAKSAVCFASYAVNGVKKHYM